MAFKFPLDAKIFKPKIIPIFLFVFFSAVFIFTGLILLHEGTHLYLIAVLIVYLLFAISSFFFSMIYPFIFPIGLSSNGIYSYAFPGFRGFVSWEDIVSIKPFRMANLLWLRLYSSKNSRVVYLALNVKPEEEFWKELKRLSPPNSPILPYLK